VTPSKHAEIPRRILHALTAYINKSVS
jgi:hypothetical protein